MRSAEFLAGGGELGALMRAFDWTRTPVGDPSTWPHSLRIVVRILLTSRYAMWLGWGPDLTFFYNDAYARMTLGARHPWALGRSVREVWAEIWPDVGPRAEKVIRTGEATWDEGLLLFLGRRGFLEETYHTFSYSPVPDDHNGVGGMLCVVTEETERTIGERRLRTLRELSAATVSVRTADDACARAVRSLAANPNDLPFALVYLEADDDGFRLAAASGLEPGGPVAPLRVADPPDDRTWPLPVAQSTALALDLAPRFGHVHAGPWPEPLTFALVVPLSQPGQERPTGYFIAGISPRRPLDDDYRGFLGLVAGHIASAIAEARAYAAEKRRAEQLAELDRAKTAFFGNVSHEFRTPLTLLLGPVEDLLAAPADSVPAERRALLEVAHRNALRLQKLVNTLLDFSRIEAGRVQAVYEPTDLAAATAELASNFRSACERAGLAFTVDCSPLPAPVHVDRDMWEKIVLNLLSNAFKFTLDGGISVALAQHGPAARLTVRDTGTGIAEDQLPHIFERFHRVEGTRARTHEGTGIGLALVQELVKLHGGQISVASVHGVGTTFTVEIPLGTAHLPQDRVAAARIHRPDLVISDVMMPGLDGFQLLTALRADPGTAAIPVILLSARAGEEATVEGLAAGADDYLVKPFSARELLARVRGLLALSAARESALRREAELRERADHILADVVAADAKFRVLFEQSTQFAAILELDGTVVETNRLSLDACGFTRHDVLGKKFWDCGWWAPDPELAARIKAACAAVARGEAFRTQTHYFLADRSARTFDLIITPVIDDAGHVLFLAPTGIDITDQKRAEDALKTSEERLREQDRRKDEFLATLAHELRNPLAPLRNGLSILRLTPAGAAVAVRTREMMERQLAHMVRLIDDLLDISRVSRGKVDLQRERVEIHDILDSALETCRPLIEARRHALELHLPDELLWLDADPTRLAQIVGNLLNNAAKFTPDGGRIQLAAARDGDHIVLRVTDSGVGIPADMLPRVFDLFVQGGRTIDRAQGGLGIGLSLVKKLSELHGGAVLGDSPGPGLGSTFRVRLPLAAREPVQPRPRTTAADHRARPGRRVLVVDDNVDGVETLAMMLELTGHAPHVAHDGDAALATARSVRPDIAFLDIGMPGMSGYEVARRFREDPALRRVVLVALTGWGSEDDKRRAAEAGFDHHLTKPVDADAIAGLLASLDATISG
jgi:PAS domain S-box-containing protein